MLNAKNLQRLHWFLGALSLFGFSILVYRLFEANWLAILGPIGLLAVARASLTLGEGRLAKKEFRGFLLISLALCFVLGAIQLPEYARAPVIAGMLGSLSLLLFRLRLVDTILLLMVLLGIAGLPFWLHQGSLEALATQAAIAITVVALSIPALRRDRRDFAERFQIERSRDREQSRMRKELDSARQIQLSMLPRRDPQFPGLDISAASLPAAEVGGDYYEYFPLDDDRLVVVLADVAGHGVASGLLLSGVRSCLHLMKGQDQSAADIVSQLDQMVRDTTEKRMFITLAYALFDLKARQLVLASAGHPPPIILRNGVASIPMIESPPLGTQLPHTFVERSIDLELGDRIVLYTDGLTEMTSDDGEMYGEDRLAARIARIAPEHNARAVREAVLTDVWNYKGNDEQMDDVTLVSIKLVEPTSAAESRPSQ